MLNRLKRMEFFSKSVVFPRKTIPLHAMITSCGHERRTSTDYDWHGLRRGVNSEFVLFQYTLAGYGMLRHHADEYRVEEGQAMLLFFPDDNRYWLPRESTRWDFIYFCLNGRDVVRIWKHMVRRSGPVIAIPGTAPVLKVAAESLRKAAGNRLRSPFQASADAYALTMALLEATRAEQQDRPQPAWFERIEVVCRRDYRRAIGVEELAELGGYSRYHFTRLFRSWAGLAPAQYLQDIRLKESIRLLQDTTMSVKEIASASGFRDSNYFCRIFRKRIGASPGGFRCSGMY